MTRIELANGDPVKNAITEMKTLEKAISQTLANILNETSLSDDDISAIIDSTANTFAASTKRLRAYSKLAEKRGDGERLKKAIFNMLSPDRQREIKAISRELFSQRIRKAQADANLFRASATEQRQDKDWIDFNW